MVVRAYITAPTRHGSIDYTHAAARTEHDEGLAHAVVGSHRVLLLEVAGREDGGARERCHIEAQLS